MSFPQHLVAFACWILCSCLFSSCIQQARAGVRVALKESFVTVDYSGEGSLEGREWQHTRGSAMRWNNCVAKQAGVTERCDPNPKPFIHHLSRSFLCRLTWTEESLHTDIYLQSHAVKKNVTTSDGECKQSQVTGSGHIKIKWCFSIVPFHSIHILWLHLKSTICLHILGKCLHSLRLYRFSLFTKR